MRRALPLFLVWLAMLAAGHWQPLSPDAVDMAARFATPSARHWLGTDNLGRDLASRLMAGAGRTAWVVVWVTGIAFAGGALIGTLAAMAGGWREALLLRLAEMGIVVPTLIMALVAGAVLGLRPATAGIALGLAGIGPFALSAHSLTRRALGLDFVRAARALGVGRAGLMLRHILPETLPVLFAQVSAQAGAAVVAFAALSFIGLGADPTAPDWGGMLFEYRMFIFDHPRLAFAPGVAIAVVVAAASLTFDPGE